MSVFCLRDDGLVISQDAVSHFTTSTPPANDSSADVLILHAPQNLSTVSPHLRNSIWSYVYPGKSEERTVFEISSKRFVTFFRYLCSG